MELVKCSNLPGEHWDAVLKIRNDNSEGFGDPSIIPTATHYRYMFENFTNYLICIDKDEIIGFIGHVDNDIRLATKKTHQIDNEASRRLFESCGFCKKYYILEK